MAASAVNLDNFLARKQAEANDPDALSVFVVNALNDDIPDIQEKRPITYLDPWNMRVRKTVTLGNDAWSDIRESNIKLSPWHRFNRIREERLTYLEAGHLRETRPDCIPVTAEKDSRSDIPDIDMKKYLVPADMPLGEFVDFVRLRIELSRKNPIFVFFKNTVPPTGALMSAIDEENKHEDGYLHMTYSGEENV